ncbi:MAG TPA: hypothetical protein VHA55_00545 [Pseudorhodoplanes sp.]|nr:hypothetical protein [Pseudorhodoplanes sp.]
MPSDHLAHQETEDTIGTGHAPKADPERELGGGHAGGGRIAIALLASFAIIVLLIYGLNNQRDETAAAPPARPPAPAPSASGQTEPLAGAGAIAQRSKAGSTGTR